MSLMRDAQAINCLGHLAESVVITLNSGAIQATTFAQSGGLNLPQYGVLPPSSIHPPSKSAHHAGVEPSGLPVPYTCRLDLMHRNANSPLGWVRSFRASAHTGQRISSNS
jgi:hypothetical protein